MMENPWAEFQHSDKMVNDLDRNVVDAFNAKAKEIYKFQLHLAPEPWIGSPTANVVVLMANPGASAADVAGIVQPKHELILERSIRNLRHELTDYPHFFFDPELAGTIGQDVWYFRTYKEVLKRVDQRSISQQLLTCEIVPYHSSKWKSPKVGMPTQAYTVHLIRQAIKRNAMILLHRGERHWMSQVPELGEYGNLWRPNSLQQSAVSPGNYPLAFDSIVEALGSP